MNMQKFFLPVLAAIIGFLLLSSFTLKIPPLKSIRYFKCSVHGGCVSGFNTVNAHYTTDSVAIQASACGFERSPQNDWKTYFADPMFERFFDQVMNVMKDTNVDGTSTGKLEKDGYTAAWTYSSKKNFSVEITKTGDK